MQSLKAKNRATLVRCEPSCILFLFLRQTLLGIIDWLKTNPMRFFFYVARK
jgi:hypothetical protein